MAPRADEVALGVEDPDEVVAPVGDIDVARIMTATPRGSGTPHMRTRLPCGIEHLDTSHFRVGDEDVLRRIDGNARGLTQRLVAEAPERADEVAGGVEDLDAIGEAVGNVDVAGVVHGYALVIGTVRCRSPRCPTCG